MKEYKCKKCNKIFYNATHLKDHNNRKKPCSVTSNINNFSQSWLNISTNYSQPDKNLIQDELKNNFGIFEKEKITSDSLNKYLEQNICVYCKTKFTLKSSVIRHIKNRCKEKQKIEIEKEIIFRKLKESEEENKNLKDALILTNKKMEKIESLLVNEKLSTKVINQNDNTQNNIYNENNLHQNLNLISYGKEDIDKFGVDLLHNASKKVYGGPLFMTQKIHFNEKFPEFHNIYIPNIKEKYAMQYTNGRWNLVNRDNLIDQIYEDKKTLISENLEKFIDRLSENKRKRLEEWIENESDNSEGTIAIKDELKLLLYNKRDMVIEHKNKMKKKGQIMT